MTTAIRMAVPIVTGVLASSLGMLDRGVPPCRAALLSHSPGAPTARKDEHAIRRRSACTPRRSHPTTPLQWQAVALHWNAHALVCAYGTFQWPTTV